MPGCGCGGSMPVAGMTPNTTAAPAPAWPGRGSLRAKLREQRATAQAK